MIRSIVLTAGLALAGLMAATPAQAQQYDRSGSSDQVRCESQGYNYRLCNVGWRDARIARQLSNTQCRKGANWGVDRRGLWVDGGCGAIFVEAGGRPGGGRPGHGGGGDWRPGNDWDRDIRFTCESQDYRYKMCQVDTGRGGQVRIERQISTKARCVEGRTWGSNRAGVWVDQGCAAVFVVERRWR